MESLEAEIKRCFDKELSSRTPQKNDDWTNKYSPPQELPKKMMLEQMRIHLLRNSQRKDGWTSKNSGHLRNSRECPTGRQGICWAEGAVVRVDCLRNRGLMK